MPLLPLALLLLTPPGTPSGGFHWKRIITPPAGAGTQQACVVLDAATFANAAPAMGDLRLFQDGEELPYVIEESYDARALDSGVTPDDDRSEYETVYAGLLQPQQAPGMTGSSAVAQGEGRYVSTVVDARVPVERIRLDPAPQGATHLLLRAVPFRARGMYDAESAEHTLSAQEPAWAVTLGANLQQKAQVTVVDQTPGAQPERVLLEMRRRSMCYQPRSAGPLELYLGGGQGISAKTYGLANGFSVSADRPYATMGPLEPNPDADRRPRAALLRSLLWFATLAAGLLLGLLIFFGAAYSRKSRAPAPPV